MSPTNYKAIAEALDLRVHFICEGDRDYHIRKQTIVPANPCCNCYSVAKAFTVTAVGMLADRGLLTPQTRVVDIFPDTLPQGMDPHWNDVTLHHLMLHTAGFGSGLLDIDAEDASAYPSPDYLYTVLSTPLPHKPGTVYQYTDAAYYLLSRIVARAAGMDIAALLRPVLMETMQFKEFAWSVCPRGYSMGATGLYLRTEDMIKLGILYLNGGEWKGTRIISRAWVDLVLENGYEFQPMGDGWYGKGGMRGQLLAFHPGQGRAFACHAYELKDMTPYRAALLAGKLG